MEGKSHVVLGAEKKHAHRRGSTGFASGLSGGAGKRFGSFRIRKLRLANIRKDLYLPVLIPAVLLVIYGLVAIWSASLSIKDASFPRQLFGVFVGFVVAALVWRCDYRFLQNMTIPLLILDAILILAPHIPGLAYSAKGMTGWIMIPGIRLSVQTSEIAKNVTILYLASIAAQYNGRVGDIRSYFRLCAAVLIPFVLIMTQPDLGTGLIILFFGATIIICSGAKRSWILGTIALVIVIAVLVVWTSQIPGLPHILKPYQLKRLTVFIDPSVDPAGSGYNLRQAMIAVGSGGLFGKGLHNVTQAGQGFLPEAHTDFIFALLAEKVGFVGSLLLIILFSWLIIATVRLAIKIETPFAKLILVGISSMWMFQVFENIGMCIGIMPITGIPLPFISFGSSSTVAQMMAVGLVQTVWRCRPRSG